ncbi:MAG: type 2 isopentenyl-diphosphate Delta-isomerase [Candidatus Methanomethyliaceae archaeon]|nr:type 2 isopentenyl-diphosphate Delta-isomerase [Candidatus Methanomethyliaceae archaeon]MDW7970378.1 type 2 isopentenyl-diphosphate Delta-isomerase [Nitrososphaerota archaeon]
MISDRKLFHTIICRDYDVSYRKSTYLDDVELIHFALPELDLEDVNISINLFGKPLSAPILISAMTGGHEETKKLNENLARAASELNIGMYVGSQRAAIENPKLEDTFRIVREVSSEILVIANIGGTQLLTENYKYYVEKAISMINADALSIHLNPLQELVQPGGDTKFRGILKILSNIVDWVNVPIVVKETGCGISKEVAEKLVNVGIHAIDVAGSGGTSWAAVEFYNAKQKGNESKAIIAKALWDWGIPTAMSLCEVLSLGSKITIISSGGIRTGLHIAKSIALGADLAGIARPLLPLAFSGYKEVVNYLNNIINELKTILVLVGCRDLKELKSTPIVIKGELLNWIIQRNLKVRGLDRIKA